MFDVHQGHALSVQACKDVQRRTNTVRYISFSPKLNFMLLDRKVSRYYPVYVVFIASLYISFSHLCISFSQLLILPKVGTEQLGTVNRPQLFMAQ